jgi:NAD(P)-dependent dehydrogenase (short-subunit alcohol dehydrogenase family)
MQRAAGMGAECIRGFTEAEWERVLRTNLPHASFITGHVLCIDGGRTLV